MASLQDGPSQYRPYHIPAPQIPPSIDATAQPAINSTRSGLKFDLGSSARDVLNDLDYSDYLSDASPSVLEVLKKLFDQGLWKYSSILIAQPFENAKIILQLQDTSFVTEGNVKQDREHGHRDRDRDREDPYFSSHSDSDDDTTSYFTSTAPTQTTRSRREQLAQRRRYSSSRSRSRHSRSSRRSHASHNQTSHTKPLPTISSLTTVISTLWTTEGAWGIWKGTNISFWHSVALSTITSFLRSFFYAVFSLPEPAISITALPSQIAKFDTLSSPAPITSLILAVSASGLAGLILSPLDIARTKLIATPSTHPPRSILGAVTSLGSWGMSSSIAYITLLHSTLPTLITASTPLMLRNRFGLDQATNPASYTILTFLSQTLELGIRLPVETALRRGQLHIAKSGAIAQQSKPRALAAAESEGFETTIPIGAYKGLWGTWYHISSEEGSRPVRATSGTAASTLKKQNLFASTRRKGQGIEGLYRGWRIAAWGLLGMWTAHFAGSSPGAGSGGF